MKTILRKIRTSFRHIRKKIDFLFHEHVFSSDEINLKYLLYKKPSSQRLTVIFSGMNAQHAVYNYVNTLRGEACSRLYILDDFGVDGLGCYYIGMNGTNKVELAVQELLKQVK